MIGIKQHFENVNTEDRLRAFSPMQSLDGHAVAVHGWIFKKFCHLAHSSPLFWILMSTIEKPTLKMEFNIRPLLWTARSPVARQTLNIEFKRKLI